MTVTQISIFVENKPGRFAEIASLLEDSNIKIYAFCIADAGDFGIIRIIVDKPDEAKKSIQNFAGSSLEVLAIPITEKIRVSKIVNLLENQNINIDYAYSSITPIKGNLALILRVSDLQKTERILTEKGIEPLKQKEL